METQSQSSRQNLTIEDPKSAGGASKRGWFVGVPTALFAAAVFLAALIAVALIVWFAIPRKKCPLLSLNEREATCHHLMKEKGRAWICGEPLNDVQEKVTEEKPDPTTGFRLNKTFLPDHYNLELWPMLEGDFGFNGSVTILMTCQYDTDVIVLHVDDLTVDAENILLKDDTGNIISINGTDEDRARHFYKIYPERGLTANTNYTLGMTFNGSLVHTDWLGFYRSSYMENGTMHWIVSTQFETHHARRCFPCFDESFFKATFNVTMKRLKSFISLSNMPLLRTEPREGDWEVDIFEKSVRMAPYLLAFSVNQFKYVESYTTDGVRMRVYTQPAFLPYAEYANTISARILQAYADWTGIPFALPKLDQIAVPSFFFGAMENWGLVIYRETALLYNPEYTTANQKRYVAYVIAHELAHQWFGNLVTCRWWDDTFLNEAFATYFGYHVGLKAAEPDWEVDEFFVRVLQHILEQDGWHNSQPIRVPDLESHEGLLKAFSRITYTKGASILRMTRNFLGSSTFQEGLQKYLRRHAYTTVINVDLYRALQEQADANGVVTWDSQKTNLSSILSSWIDQQNYPVLYATDQGDGSLKVRQSHFLFEPDKNLSYPTPFGSEFLWDIPLTYTDTTLQPGFTWMLREPETRIRGLQQNGWKMLNLDLMGFYRTRYGLENWNRILVQLLHNHTVFPVENRAGFIDDAFYLAKAGLMEEVDALRSTQYLKTERRYLPWYPGVKARLPYYLDMFYGTPVYDLLEKYIVDLVLPMYNISGWTVPQNHKGILDRFTRIIVIETACTMNYKPCVDKAQALFDQFMNNPAHNPIHPDLRALVYCTAVARGGNREWDFMLGRYHHKYGDVYVAYENYTVGAALSCATMPNIIRKYLDYALARNSRSMFASIAMKRDARDSVWNYMTEQWDQFVDGNTTRISKSDVLTAVTSTWSTTADLRKLEEFIASHNEKDLAKTYKSIREKLKDNIEWVEDNKEPIDNWLRSVITNQIFLPGPVRRRRRRSIEPEVIRGVDNFHDVHQVAVTA